MGRAIITQQRHDVAVTLPNVERTSLISDPTPRKPVNDSLVVSYLIHHFSRHLRDQSSQPRLRKVLEARLHDQFSRAVRSGRVFPESKQTMSPGVRPELCIIYPQEVLIRLDQRIVGSIQSLTIVVKGS